MRLQLAILTGLTIQFCACGTNDVSPANTNQPAVVIRIPVGANALGVESYGNIPVSISAGTTVVWINDDHQPHSATSDTGTWTTGSIEPEHKASVTFQASGTFPYHCAIHGDAHVGSTIIVR